MEDLEAFGRIPTINTRRQIKASASTTTRTRSRRVSAAARCGKISSFARKSPTSTTSGFPSGSFTHAARRLTATFRSMSRSPSTIGNDADMNGVAEEFIQVVREQESPIGIELAFSRSALSGPEPPGPLHGPTPPEGWA
jgi:hypothetical protein